MKDLARFFLWVVIILIIVAGAVAWLRPNLRPSEGVKSPARDQRVLDWIQNPTGHPDWAIEAKQRCGNAPFLLPTSGYIGYLWDDGFQPGHRHQGIDIFAGTDPNLTPVYAAADGYLSRLTSWVSSVIIRLPQDPLNPSRQIWTYYTHMADAQGATSFIVADFPPGTSEVFVQAGTLLGYQGNFSGTPGSPVGVHLHFSIVLDDGSGRFTNELQIDNTLDPSPYLGIHVNARSTPPDIPLCTTTNGGE